MRPPLTCLAVGLCACTSQHFYNDTYGGGIVHVSVTNTPDPTLDLDLDVPGLSADALRLVPMPAGALLGMGPVDEQSLPILFPIPTLTEVWVRVDLSEPFAPCGVQVDQLDLTINPYGIVLPVFNVLLDDGGVQQNAFLDHDPDGSGMGMSDTGWDLMGWFEAACSWSCGVGDLTPDASTSAVTLSVRWAFDRDVVQHTEIDL